MTVTKVMAASLTDERRRQMKAEVTSIMIEAINEGDRLRSVDPQMVAEIYRSIEHVGLLQPISVKTTPVGTVGYALVSGAHRFRAWRQKFDEAVATGDKDKIGRWSTIPAVLYPVDMPPDLIESVEIQENLVRKDLTPDQRLALGGKYLEWLQKEEERQKEAQEEAGAKVGTGKPTSTSGTGKPTSTKTTKGPTKDWFTAWYEGAKIPKVSAHRTWDRFLAETEREKVTPGSKEGVELQKIFSAWAKQAEAKPDERKAAAKAAQEAADAKKQAADKEKALTALQNSTRTCVKLGATLEEIAEALYGALGSSKETSLLIGQLQLFEKVAA